MRPWRWALHWQILAALILAVLLGLALDGEGRLFGVPLRGTLDLIGALFLNALKMLIVPLILASIISGISGVAGGRGLGRLGAKTLAYYATSSTLAILVGLAMVNATEPGLVDGQPARDVIGLSVDTEAVRQQVGEPEVSDLSEILLRLLPPNIVAAAAEGQMLGLIVFALLVGLALHRIEGGLAKVMGQFWDALFAVMMRITDWVIRTAPLGVLALVGGVVADTGTQALGPLASFFFTVLAALAIHALLVLPALLFIVGGIRQPWRQYQAMSPALLTAFSTASSSATLPLTMECVERRAGVSNRVTSFTLPLGATVNMDGTALYECVAALFIAQAYGIVLGPGEQFAIVLIALLTSIGVAGIPAASLVAISIILASMGLPAEGIGLLLAVDRILDMCRTSVNVFSDSCGAVIIARSEGEQEVLKLS